MSPRQQQKQPDPVIDPQPLRSQAAEARIAHQDTWVDLQVRQAIERGDFDNLPGKGKPIAGLGDEHDPDWWLKRLIERERVRGLAPAAILLRLEDARFESEIDELAAERLVRSHIEDFNQRVIQARRQLQGGPPVITPLRDVEKELAAWQARRRQRRTSARAEPLPQRRRPPHLRFRRRSRDGADPSD